MGTSFCQISASGLDLALFGCGRRPSGALPIYLCYDPFDINDARQAKRLPSEWVTPLRAPGCGHKTALVLQRAEFAENRYAQRN